MSMADARDSSETFQMGRVLSRTFGAIARNVALFLGLALILQGIPALVFGLWGAFASTVDTDSTPALIAIGVGGLFSFLGTMVLEAAVTRAIVSDLALERPDFAACLKVGLTVIFPMIGLTVIAGLGIALASILLIVPGLMLYVAWSVAVPAYVQERIGILASLERSSVLTTGSRWKIFAILLVWWIVALVLQAPADLLMASVHAPPYAQVPLKSVVTVVTSMVLATIRAAIYVELRDVKEGVLPKDLEVIFS